MTTTIQYRPSTATIDMTNLRGKQTRTMSKGDQAIVGFGGWGALATFLGYSNDGAKVVWDDIDAVKAEGRCVAWGKGLEELCAHFFNPASGREFVAYRYNGRWVYGSDLHVLQVRDAAGYLIAPPAKTGQRQIAA
jgi:hypothetical protein